nr:hypothetical protein [Myxococcota bacterium]
MKPPDIAIALGLTRCRHCTAEWIGERGGIDVGALMTLRGHAALGHTLFATHAIPLRAGMLIEERSPMAGGVRTATIGKRKDLRFGERELDARIRARASEETVARALLRASAQRLLALAPEGELAVDDQRAWLARTSAGSREVSERLLDGLVELSRTLVAARAITRAAFESSIAPVWSEVAERFELAWSPERSTLSGERRGVKLEARVDGEPGLLYTELYLEWSTLGRGLAIDRRGARGVVGPTVSAHESAPVE